MLRGSRPSRFPSVIAVTRFLDANRYPLRSKTLCRPNDSAMSSISREPACEVCAHEGVIGEMRVSGADAIDLLHLAGSKRLVRLEAPDAFEQALTPQDFVAPADH